MYPVETQQRLPKIHNQKYGDNISGILVPVYILQLFIYLNNHNLLFILKCTDDNDQDKTDVINVHYKQPVHKTGPVLLYRQST